jgi:hypothetical protein
MKSTDIQFPDSPFEPRNDWEMAQLDIKTAFLYEIVEEELYIEQPNIGTKKQLADKFTKAMDKSEYHRCRDMIGVLLLVNH